MELWVLRARQWSVFLRAWKGEIAMHEVRASTMMPPASRRVSWAIGGGWAYIHWSHVSFAFAEPDVQIQIAD